MDWFAKRFIQASLVWLCVGASIGLAMAIHPAFAIYRTAHLHAMLLGFIAMMIFGVGYHVLPRFSGSKLRSRGAAAFHVWSANIGLAGMVVGFILRVSSRVPQAIAAVPLAIGAVLSAAGAFVFAWNLWVTIGGSGAIQVRRARAIATAGVNRTRMSIQQ